LEATEIACLMNPPFPRLVRTSFVVAILDRAGRVLPAAGAGARRTFLSLQLATA
jgi:hypothetical protein